MKTNKEQADNGLISDNKKVVKYSKKRVSTRSKKLDSIDEILDSLKNEVKDLRKEKKGLEKEINEKLYSLIGKAIWENLEDTKKIGEREYHKQVNELKKTLMLKIKKESDKDILRSKKLMD